MSVSEPIRVVGPFVGDGVLVELDFDFETLAVSDISVLTYDADGDELTLTLNTDYTVTLNPGSAGGTVTLSDPLAVGFEAFVNGDAMPYTRTGNIITNPGGFFPSIVNAALDRVHIALLQLAAKVGRALTLPVDPTTVAGRFPVVLGDGSFGWSSGTGADDGLRVDLADDGGPLVTVEPTGANAVARTLRTKIFDVIAPADYGGIANALSIVRDGDTPAFTGSIEIPKGVIQVAAAQALQDTFNRIHGSGGGTYWQTNAAANVFENTGAQFTLSRFEGFRTYGGIHSFAGLPAGEVATLVFSKIDNSQFTGDAYHFSGGVTSCTWMLGYSDSTVGDHGIYSGGGINNDNLVFRETFTNIAAPAIKMETLTQGLWVCFCRAENGGVNGQAVFDFEGAVGVRLFGGWYEAHHETLLKQDSTSVDGTVIDGIIDIGAHVSAGVFKASLFDVGERLIVFGTNIWNNITTAPKNILVNGLNDKLYAAASNLWEHKSQRGGKVHLRKRNTIADTATIDLLTFTRSASTPDTTGNLQTISGVLTLTYVGLNDSGVIARRTEQWPISVEGVGALFDFEVGTAYGGNTANANTVTVVPSEKAGATATSITLQIAVTNAHASEANLIDATFEFNNNSNLSTNLINVIAL